MRTHKDPPRTLTVILRNYAPSWAFKDPVEHRTVRIRLTDEQCQVLRLRCTHEPSPGQTYFEEISQCILEDPHDQKESDHA